MKFRTKKVVPATNAGEVQVQLSVPMYGVLRDVQDAFFGLCVEAGKATLAAMMEADRERICGAKGRPDEQRRAYRGGHTAGSVVLGGRRMRCSGRVLGQSKAASWRCRLSRGPPAAIRWSGPRCGRLRPA